MPAISANAHAETGQIGLAIKAGTLGGGLEISMDINPYLELRTGINQISFDFDTTIGDIDYNFAPDFFTSSLLLDLHPLGNAFRFTAGAFINNNEIDIDGTYRQDLLSPELARYADLIDQAHVVGLIEFDTFAPYLGIGWTSNHNSESRWGVNIDLGIMFQGTAQVSELRVEDPWGAGSLPATQLFIQREREEIEKEIDEYEYYPIASLSLSYKF
ncbi:hypothetical protein [Candidatus Electrothrix sp.]|uniref:hypothetical protein n=1 Tax=Candidatus Electrothrix sp. TaxID=2170559 RepID=UPI0040565FAF